MANDIAYFLKLMKKAALEVVTASKPASFYYGKVVSIDPLTVSINDKLKLHEKLLIVPSEYTRHEVVIERTGTDNITGMYDNRLVIGDEVILLRNQGGQQYTVIGRRQL